MGALYSTVWMCYILLIHSAVDESLGCVQLLSTMKNAVMSICVQVFVWTYVFISLGYIPRSGIAGSYGNFTFKLLRNCWIVFQHGCTILHSLQDVNELIRYMIICVHKTYWSLSPNLDHIFDGQSFSCNLGTVTKMPRK